MGKLSKSSNSTFEPCPEGQFSAVLVDVVDLGWQETTYEGKPTGMKPKIQMVWQVDEVDEETSKRYLVFGRRAVLSADPKANLRKELNSWLGATVVEEMLEKDEFDLDTLIGKTALLDVIHNVADNGNTYANINSLMKLPKGMQAIAPLDYTRRCDRDDWEEKQPEFSAFDTYTGDRKAPAKPAARPAEKAEPLEEEPLADTAPEDTAPQDNAKPTAPSRPPVSLLIEIAKQAELTWGRLYDDALDALCKKTVKVGTNDLDVEQAHQVLDALRNLKPAPPPIKAQEAADDDGGPDPFADEGEVGYTEAPAAPALVAAPKTRQRNTAHV